MVKLYDEIGEQKDEIELPKIFKTNVRPDLIKKAVLSSQSKRKQPYGSNKEAGFRTTAESWGAGRGSAMVPRIKDGRRAAIVPQAVGGRKAHPPKAEKQFEKDINKKEKNLAIKSAIAATSKPEIVEERGHKFETAPIIVEDAFNQIKKTKEVKDFLEIVGAYQDIERAKNKRKRIKKGYRTPRSLLIVCEEDNGIKRGARNLPGVDLANVDKLNAELLAPGTNLGRFTLYTQSALSKIEEVFR
ncbi:50S ribosomal protein L4 [archaeon SCG-AAA382B04]|nr:50S ribosomal protein L4 [archaeon SCG-AAA382B04]